MSWHDLALYLISRYVGPLAAQATARILMREWHDTGQTPYIEFTPAIDHDDGLVAELQRWLESDYMVSNPVQQLAPVRISPGGQQLRISEARRLLERTTMPVEKIGFAVGYENIAYFRRLFQRTTRLTPGAYRRKFRAHLLNRVRVMSRRTQTLAAG